MTEIKKEMTSKVEGVPKVYAAIAKVAKLLSEEGISKGRKNEQQGYKFRGIDDIYNALSSNLSDAGLVILTRVIDREVTERATAKGGVLFYVTLKVEFDFVCAEDGSKHTVTTIGEAMDSGDKATNKAMSAAYKYACIQTFCIPTEGDNDSENQTHEVASKGARKQPEPEPYFNSKSAETAWLAPARLEVEALKSPEEIAKWRTDHKEEIDGLSEEGWTALRADLAKQIKAVSQSPMNKVAA